jgi:hypothetical protein
MTAQKFRRVRAWAIFTDGRMLMDFDVPWLFASRRRARSAGMDVRRVEIVEIPPKRKAKHGRR